MKVIFEAKKIYYGNPPEHKKWMQMGFWRWVGYHIRGFLECNYYTLRFRIVKEEK